MQILSRRDQFFCALLSPEEDALARRIKFEMAADWAPSGLADSFNAMINLQLSDPQVVPFGLFKGDPAHPIGETSIRFWPDAVFTGSYVKKAHRGNRLVDLLYEARMKYLQTRGIGYAQSDIEDENGPSRKAAERNGFEPAGQTYEDDQIIWHYARAIPALSPETEFL